MPAGPPCPARNVPKVENIGLFWGIFDQKYAARAVPLCNPIPRWPLFCPFGQKNAARGVLDARTNLARIGTLKPGFQVQGSQSARMTAVLTRFRWQTGPRTPVLGRFHRTQKVGGLRTPVLGRCHITQQADVKIGPFQGTYRNTTPRAALCPDRPP